MELLNKKGLMLKIGLSFAIIFLSLSTQAVDMTKSTEISTSSFEVPAARYENLSNVVTKITS